MPAQYVRPYVKTNKSDYIDAHAIAEALQRPMWTLPRGARGHQAGFHGRVRDWCVISRQGTIQRTEAHP
jgi:hypothetical protein